MRKKGQVWFRIKRRFTRGSRGGGGDGIGGPVHGKETLEKEVGRGGIKEIKRRGRKPDGAC